jgi:hypothetical protein
MNRVHEVIVEHGWDIFLKSPDELMEVQQEGPAYLRKVSLTEDYKQTSLSTSSIAYYDLLLLASIIYTWASMDEPAGGRLPVS